MRKRVSTQSFRRQSTPFATLFDRVAARTSNQRTVVADFYPGVAVPVTVKVVGEKFEATYRTEQQARRAAFLGMAQR